MNRLPSCVINPDAEARVGARAGEPLTPPPPRGGSNSSRPPGGAALLRSAPRRGELPARPHFRFGPAHGGGRRSGGPGRLSGTAGGGAARR